MYEEEKRAELEAIATRPPVWPSLHPELRIAKLFQEPTSVLDDPVYAEICAKPVLPPTAPPPEYNGNQQHGGGQHGSKKNSPSPMRGSSNNSPTRRAGGGGRDDSPPARRPTPLDILHAANNNPDEVEGNERFGATAFEEDFGKLPEGAAAAAGAGGDNSEFEPQKLYRVTADGVKNPLKKLRGDDLPPLDTLPRMRPTTGDDTPADKRRVGFADEKQQRAANNNKDAASNVSGSSRTGSAATFAFTSDDSQHQEDNIYSTPNRPNEPKVSSTSKKKKGEEEQMARFEIDLDPPPPLMTALLHLSRDGGNIDAMRPLDQQAPLLIDAQNSHQLDKSKAGGGSSTVVLVEGVPQHAGNATTPGSASARLQSLQHSRRGKDNSPSRHVAVHNNPVMAANSSSKTSVSPTRGSGGATEDSPPSALRENSMSPRRKLPLVFTDYGEVVSRTGRDDARSLPSFMRRDAHSHRLQTLDPAQSYWNCFAPQKAQGLVGVRMPTPAIEAFEEAADMQVDSATPPKRVTGVVPTMPRNLRTSKPPATSLRQVLGSVTDAGESSAHRADRRW